MSLEDELAKAIRGSFPPEAGVTSADSIIGAYAALYAITEARRQRALKAEAQMGGKPKVRK